MWSGNPWDSHLTLKEQPARSAREIGKDLYRERQRQGAGFQVSGFRTPPRTLLFSASLSIYISSTCQQAGESPSDFLHPLKMAGELRSGHRGEMRGYNPRETTKTRGAQEQRRKGVHRTRKLLYQTGKPCGFFGGTCRSSVPPRCGMRVQKRVS